MNAAFRFLQTAMRFFAPPKVDVTAKMTVTANVAHPMYGNGVPVPFVFSCEGPTDVDNDGKPEILITGSAPNIGRKSVRVEMSPEIAGLFVRLLQGDLDAATEMVELTFTQGRAA